MLKEFGISLKLEIKPFTTDYFPEMPFDYDPDKEKLTTYAVLCKKIIDL